MDLSQGTCYFSRLCCPFGALMFSDTSARGEFFIALTFWVIAFLPCWLFFFFFFFLGFLHLVSSLGGSLVYSRRCLQCILR